MNLENAKWSEPEVWGGDFTYPYKGYLYIRKLGQNPKNCFSSEVVVQFLVHEGPDRLVRVYRPFSFFDRDGREFPVPEGAIANGANIPRILWTIYGPPFVGDYRRISVVHDYYCNNHVYDSRIVHQMIYDGTLLDSKSRFKANTVSKACYWLGPDFKAGE